MMYLQCDSNGAVYNTFNSADCTGQGTRRVDTVGTCLTASSGSLIFTCASNQGDKIIGIAARAMHSDAAVKDATLQV